MTVGYPAGIETNATQITYVVESTFMTPPASGWKAIRYVSENLSGNKNRNRPNEINISREATQGVTISESAAGTITGALSYSTYDDFFASAFNSVFPTPVALTSIGTDLILTVAGTITLGAAAGKFTNLVAGQWIRLLSTSSVTGFTANNGVNNGLYRIISMNPTTPASATTLTLAAPFHTPVTETPSGTTGLLRACQMINGSAFSSLYIQQMLTKGSYYLLYPGSYVTGFTISGSIGQFVQASFPIIATQELKGTAETSGSVASGSGASAVLLSAPTGTVNNTVGNFLGISWNDVLIPATVDQFSITVDNAGAQAEYGLGSPFAAGVLAGTFTASGSMRMYFKDFTLYNAFKGETAGKLSIATRDAAGSGYVFTFPNALLLNPEVTAGGPGQSVMATFTIEGNPQTTATGGTLFIDRLINS